MRIELPALVVREVALGLPLAGEVGIPPSAVRTGVGGFGQAAVWMADGSMHVCTEARLPKYQRYQLYVEIAELVLKHLEELNGDTSPDSPI